MTEEYPRPEPGTVYLQWNYGWGNWEQVIDEAAGRDGVFAFVPASLPPSGEDWAEVVQQAIADTQFGGSFNGLEWPEAWDHFGVLAQAALTSLTPLLDKVRGEALEEAAEAVRKLIPVLPHDGPASSDQEIEYWAVGGALTAIHAIQSTHHLTCSPL